MREWKDYSYPDGQTNFKWTYKTWNSIEDYQRIVSTPEEKLKFGKQTTTIHSIQGELEADFYSETEKTLDPEIETVHKVRRVRVRRHIPNHLHRRLVSRKQVFMVGRIT
ncbi:MAG: hypothetical protein DI538_12145 [Azospira oryzae]|nr:MAG: hypothetical protein DI538_12145 [Azospira oryzae]